MFSYIISWGGRLLGLGLLSSLMTILPVSAQPNREQIPFTQVQTITDSGDIITDTIYTPTWISQWYEHQTKLTHMGPTLDQVIRGGIRKMRKEDIANVTVPYDPIIQIPVPLLYAGGTYELNALIKNPISEGATPARDIHLVIFGLSGKAEVNTTVGLSAERYAFAAAGGTIVKSSMGQLLQGYDQRKRLSLVVANGRIKVRIQDRGFVIDKPYIGTVGMIRGISLSTRGSASIDDVRLIHNGRVVGLESFDLTGTTTMTFWDRKIHNPGIPLATGQRISTGEVQVPDFTTEYSPYTQKLGGYTLLRYYYDQEVKRQREAERQRLELLAKQQDQLAKLLAPYACYIEVPKVGVGPGCNPVQSTDQLDPINLTRLSFQTDQTLMILPMPRGQSLRFQLAYDNQVEYPGPVGYNRDHNHNITAGIREDGDLMIEGMAGQQGQAVIFTKQGDNSWTHTPSRAVASLDIGQNLRVEYQDGRFQLFRLNAKGQFQIWLSQDQWGNTVTYEYDQDRLVRITTPLDQSITLSYDANGQIKEVNSSLGEKVVLSYESTPYAPSAPEMQYHLTKLQFVAGGQQKTISYTYTKGKQYANDNGNMLTMTDAKGQVYVTNTYDAQDRAIAQQYGPDRGSYTYTMQDDLIKTLTVTDRKNVKTTYVYDVDGNVLERTTQTAQGPVRYAYTYDDAGRMLTITDPLGQIVTFAYDTHGNLSSMTYGDQTREYQYDSVTRTLLKSVSPVGLETQVTRTAQGLPTTVVQIDRQSGQRRAVAMEYDTKGQLVRTTNGYGTNTMLSWAEGRVTSIRIPALDREQSFVYDDRGNLIRQTDGEGGVTTLTRDPRGKPLTTTSPEGITQAWSYDPTNNITSASIQETDGRRISQTMTYTDLDLLSSVTAPGDSTARTTTMTSTPHHLPELITSPKQTKTKYEYDELDRLVGVTILTPNPSPSERGDVKTVFTYDLIGRTTSVTDAEGKKTSYTYDTQSRVSEVINHEGGKRLMQYDDNNLPVEVRFVDAQGVQLTRKTWTRNARGQPLTVTQYADDATPLTIQYEYDVLGNPTKLTDPKGTSQSMKYNGIGELVSHTDRLGNVTRYTYDRNGRVVKTVLTPTTNQIPPTPLYQGGVTTTYRYDRDGRLVGSTDNLNQSNSRAYNNRGQLVRFTDAKGVVSRYTYNDAGELKQVLRNDGSQAVVYTYHYDLHGNVVKIVDANGNTTRREYDFLDRPTKQIYPDGSSVSYRRDRVSNLAGWTDANGTTVTNTYDDLHRLIRRNVARGANVLGVTQETYQYDGLGRLVSATDDQGNDLMFSYDQASRLTSETNNSQTVAYQYDNNSNLTNLTYPSGKMFERGYDKGDRITDLSVQGSVSSIEGGTLSRNKEYQYDSLRLLGEQNSNQTTTSYAYDELLRVKQLSHTTTQSAPYDRITYQYSYDPVGNITADGRDKYTYDNISQLTNVQYNVGSQVIGTNGEIAVDGGAMHTNQGGNQRIDTWNYDAMGNRKTHHTTVPMDDWFDTFSNEAGGAKKQPTKTSNVETNNYSSLQQDDRQTLDGMVAMNDDMVLDSPVMVAAKDKNQKKEENNNVENNAEKKSDKQQNQQPSVSSEPSESSLSERCAWKEANDKTGGGDGRRKKCEGSDESMNPDEGGGSSTGSGSQTGSSGAITTGSTTIPPKKPISTPKTSGRGEGSSLGGRSVDDETFSYTKNNLNQYTAVADASGHSFTMKYDKAGNMIENDEFRFQYDYKNRLVKATRKIPGEYMIVTMKYDVLGRRVEKHIDRKSNEGEKVRYTYSNLDAIQEERTYNIGEGRNLKKELIYGAGIDDIEGYILTRGEEVRTFRYHKNHQNSVIAITDGTGKVVESYRYDAFGNLILGFSKNAGKQSTLPGAKNEQRNTNQQDSKMWLKNDRLYTAREYDEELKMYYYRGRHYDPRIGRFIQRDPIDMVDDVNLYRYVGNNPVNYTDPMGLSSKQAAVGGNKYLPSIPRVPYMEDGPVGSFVNGMAFGANVLVSAANGFVSLGDYSIDVNVRGYEKNGIMHLLNPIGSSSQIVGGDVYRAGVAVQNYVKNTSYDQMGSDAYKTFTDVRTYENIGGALIPFSALGKLGTAAKGGQLLGTVTRTAVGQLDDVLRVTAKVDAVVPEELVPSLNASQKLPPLQGRNLGEINQTLTDAGFSLKNPGNPRNQNRCHPDGSICRVNPIGHPPAQTNPHLHKELGVGNSRIRYDDYGNIIGDYKSPEVHIPINP